MRKGDQYLSKNDGRVYFYFNKLGFPSGASFKQVLAEYVNALLNTKGGILVFGVEPNGTIKGCNMCRTEEDLYRLELDNEVRAIRPTVSPSLCRFVVTQLEGPENLFLVEIKIGAGPIGEIFMNSSEQVYVIRKRKLFGPLIPQEIKDLVIAKYREDITSSCHFLSPKLTKDSEDAEQEKPKMK